MAPERGAPPTATYRLQLRPDFPFDAARQAVPYLASLGVSHLHLSPVLEAVPGSTHGYDVVDHTAVRAELGGEAGLRALAGAAREHGLGLVADIVPNHMAVPVPERLNRPLWEVLREGPGSPYARWFDIDWGALRGKLLLPVLGGPIGDELKHLVAEHGVLHYHDHEFPLRPGTENLPLPALLDAQWYRLGWWRLARTELNYRRFFTVSGLIAVRVEDPEVFAATHAKLLELVRDGVVEGLRVDHPDGLADPEGYLRQLDRAVADAAGGGRWTVVEKILGPDERLPAHWPVAGTTGYDALRHVDGLFTDPDGLAALTGIYRRRAAPAADRGGDWPATARRAAYEMVAYDLAAEVERLVRTAARICGAAPRLRDHAPWALRTAIRELLVRLPVYRPYARPGAPVPPVDAAMLEEAAEAARADRAAFPVPQEARAVDAVRDAALGRLGDAPDHRDFCARFAQAAGALRAKSAEDRAFYRYVPLLSATEVGGEPGRATVAPHEFHAYCARLLRDWPATGTALTTHDTKRSADVRARIAALTEAPEQWEELLDRLARPREEHGVRPPAAPDPHVAWAAWQTAFGLGSGPPAGAGPQADGGSEAGTGEEAATGRADRLAGAVLKGEREAALRTTWTEPDPVYEERLAAFVAAGPAYAGDTPDFAAFERDLADAVRATTLGAALLHLTMPGVPDVYMGTEHEYRALVDPDNRRPPGPRPDLLARLAADLEAGRPAEGLSAEKLRVTAAALRLRRRHPEWFGPAGSYVPLEAHGPSAAHCVAFVRGHDGHSGSGPAAGLLGGGGGAAVTAVTRLARRLAEAGGWEGDELPLPPGRWRDLLTGREAEGRCPLGELFAVLPVALLVRA
ncbi:malto-oligosyltrehalose synthase [Streptomyces sp. B1866]|uniref:malto-oligosyltrehalose synthase n=1 Tax=Streptomyces sp. B1866 TaxID=3075431 RepID=UPI002891E27A|nr:malto-oligosyltrehalose synthase [Streptomyces sp. B1866]MDT3396435.1 malto-oligosyltrehalose synthase [Streptomyces sp. B1866]